MTEEYRLWKGLRVRLVDPDITLLSIPPQQSIEIPAANGSWYHCYALVEDLGPDPKPDPVYTMRFSVGDRVIYNFREARVDHKSDKRGVYSISWAGEGYVTVEGVVDEELSPMPMSDILNR